MRLKTTRWDVADNLRNDKETAAHLEAVFEDGDPAV